MEFDIEIAENPKKNAKFSWLTKKTLLLVGPQKGVKRGPFWAPWEG